MTGAVVANIAEFGETVGLNNGPGLQPETVTLSIKTRSAAIRYLVFISPLMASRVTLTASRVLPLGTFFWEDRFPIEMIIYRHEKHPPFLESA
jgi:hypothetical protein